MRLLATRLDVEYDRPFRRPIFKVSQSSVEILECFYDALSSEYPLAMSDLSAAPAVSMGDVAIRVKLFRGQGLLEVGAEKFTARFDGLQSRSDVDVVKTAIRLSENALERGLPGIEYNGAAIRTSTWSACEGGKEAVQAMLDKYDAPKENISAEKFGAEHIINSVVKRLTNEKDGWLVNFLLEFSELVGFHLFLRCDILYTEHGKFINFDGRAEHFENIYSCLLEQYGFEGISDSQDA